MPKNVISSFLVGVPGVHSYILMSEDEDEASLFDASLPSLIMIGAEISAPTKFMWNVIFPADVAVLIWDEEDDEGYPEKDGEGDWPLGVVGYGIIALTSEKFT